jgi:hypothetical protein
MGRLENEGRTAMAVLLDQGHSQAAVAGLLAVTEGAVRYHRKRQASGSADGRSKQDFKASAYAAAIAHWRDQQEGGGINLAALHAWLQREHGYDGSLKSVQRYWKRTFPAPAIRARRRVETPAGAQAQVDWVAFPGRCQTDENRSQERQDRCPLYRKETPPLSESSGAVGLEGCSGVEVAFQIEMVMNGSMDGHEFL